MEQILEKSRTLMKTNAFLHFNNEMFSHPALQWNVSCRKCVQMLYKSERQTDLFNLTL